MSSGSLPFASYHRASQLGEGSFGSVVTVYNDDGEEYALKLFLPDDETEQEEDDDDSFTPAAPIEWGALREISCLRILRGDNKHSNIIELQDLQADWGDDAEGEGGAGTSGCLGMALPLGKSGSMASAIEKGTFTGYPKVVKAKLAHGLLSAVAFLHDNGIVHRDIKCDNILLEHNGNDWSSLLIDFSLAKPINGSLWDNDQNLTNVLDTAQHTGDVGTVVYTAPEVVHQEQYGKPFDLWSVGVVLLELLQNELFTAEKPKEAAAQIANAVSKLPDSAPFPDLVRELLQRDPSDRPTASKALQHELFTKFGLHLNEECRRINIGEALPYDVHEEDAPEENEPPNQHSKLNSNGKNAKKKLERRLKMIDKILPDILDGDVEHPLTRVAALEYSIQLEQLEDEIDDIKESQSLMDCCVLAHRFFELDAPDFEDLDERERGPFSSWSLSEYIDNEATIFMLMDYCLYPRAASLK